MVQTRRQPSVTHRFLAIYTVKVLSGHVRTSMGRYMGNRKPAGRLIIDSFLLVLCIVLLWVNVLLAQDMLLALPALGGVLVFSIKVGRDVRSRRIQ